MSDAITRLNRALEGRYHIERELGEGGMAIVYLAQDEKHRRPVAIKVLRPELGAAMGVERFVREVEIAARLNHPNILSLHDSGEADGLLYFVMPFIEGESLRDRLDREGTLSLDDATRVVREVGGALAYAHECGLVHRDIKPENILFQAGHAVVCDFGIAKAVNEAKDHLTRTGFSVGTLAYMSPEQLSDDAVVDGRADIYSLGCILHEMLEGEPPFAASTSQAAMVKKLMGELPEQSTRTDVPATVRDVISKSLSSEADDRFSTSEEFVSALGYATTGMAIERDAHRRRRQTAMRTASVALGVGVLGAGGWWLMSALRAPAVETVAVVPVMSGEDEQDFFVNDVYRDLTVELAKVGVRVKSPGAVTPYLGGPLSIPRIATDLGVDAVLIVDATLAGTSVDSELVLVDGETEDILWVQDFTGDERQILAFLGSMTVAVAAEVGLTVSQEARARFAAAPEADPAVLDALRKADFYWEQLTEEGLASALAYYELALERDPTSAEAWTGIAQVWFLRAQQGLVSSEEGRERAEPALDSAVRYDPTLAQVQASIALRKTWSEWEWEEARVAFEAALERNPLDATNRAYFSHLLLYLGEDQESLAQIERARSDEPPNSLIQGLYAQNLNARGRSEDARDALLAALAYEAGVPYLLSTLRTTYHLLGEYDLAIDSWRASFSVRGSYDANVADDARALAVMDQYVGGEDSYERTLQRLAELYIERARTEYVTPWRIGTLYARAGMAEEAIHYLTEAVEQRDQNSPSLSVEDTFDFLRGDPRFQALITRMGLPLR